MTKMRHTRTHPSDREERTPEVTGVDASMDEAMMGDAGNGADPFDADMTGGLPADYEDDPDDPEDILPDRIGRFPGEPLEEEETEPTARPHEAPPIDPRDLP